MGIALITPANRAILVRFKSVTPPMYAYYFRITLMEGALLQLFIFTYIPMPFKLFF